MACNAIAAPLETLHFSVVDEYLVLGSSPCASTKSDFILSQTTALSALTDTSKASSRDSTGFTIKGTSPKFVTNEK
ncbi:hypothetical protein D3C86_2174170 [compost metagenome]